MIGIRQRELREFCGASVYLWNKLLYDVKPLARQRTYSKVHETRLFKLVYFKIVRNCVAEYLGL